MFSSYKKYLTHMTCNKVYDRGCIAVDVLFYTVSTFCAGGIKEFGCIKIFTANTFRMCAFVATNMF